MTEPAPVLTISRTVVDALKHCAAAAYPLECCGLLVGSREPGPASGAGVTRVSRILPTPNRSATPRRAFEVDPAMHIALLRALREQTPNAAPIREQVIGHFHSHPDAPAVPSARDVAQAMDPDAVWLIVAASAVGAAEIAAWQAMGDAAGAIGFRPMAVVERDD